jgi:ABC-type uncharacterized transport system permease subunit
METDLGLWAIPVAILGGAIRVSTPFLFVSLGEVLTERSGRINLGLEGHARLRSDVGLRHRLSHRLALGRRAGGALAGSLFGLLHGLHLFAARA